MFDISSPVSALHAVRALGQGLADLKRELDDAARIDLIRALEELQAQAAAAKGAPPGVSTGPVSAKGVGPVNVSYDTAAGSEEGGGNYNLTTYGTRYLNLMKMFGRGGFQL